MRSSLTRPSPRHDLHGFATTLPLPAQCGQVAAHENTPFCMRHATVARQVVQVDVLPSSEPLPSQPAHAIRVGTSICLSPPNTASSRSSSSMYRVEPRAHVHRARAHAENIAEDVAENVADIAVESIAGAAASAHPVLECRVSVTVIRCALLCVGEDLVRFLGFLELFLCGWIVRAAIGMALHSQAPERLLEVILGCGALGAEHFVVAAFGHRDAAIRE